MTRASNTTANGFARWHDDTIFELARELRWSYLPPLMVYLSAGVWGLTAIVGIFFVKEYLGLSAVFLATLGFWAGIPWALKMPLGHLVDLIWPWKSLLVYIGAIFVALSLGIMYGLIVHTEAMSEVMSVEAWYVLSTLLAPLGHITQDVVADAMTIEAIPLVDDLGNAYPDDEIKLMHTTMQTLGRVAVVFGNIVVALMNIVMFSGVELMSEAEKLVVYAEIYLMSLAIPVISVSGVILGGMMIRARARRLRQSGLDEERIKTMLFAPAEETQPNWWILGGSLLFIALTLGIGLNEVPMGQEIIWVGSLVIIVFLMYRLVLELDPGVRKALVGTAIILFAFKAVPLPGPGVRWWEIDVLGFDQRFLSVLSLITSGLALLGMFLLRRLMAEKSVAYLVGVLTVFAGILSLPNIGLYFGIHEWTAPLTGGVVDARFIAVLDTALESPLTQITIIPMLAWMARNAPMHLKATFFAVMLSFTNLAWSASNLGTRYVNEIYTVAREVRNDITGMIEVPADHSEVGWLLITVALITVLLPLGIIAIVQSSPLRTQQ